MNNKILKALTFSLPLLLVGCLNNNSTSKTSTSSAVGQPSKPYNILYIMTDDHAQHAVGRYGGRLAELNPTPTIDQLAAEGMAFDHVFATNSICSPSRATILTGQYSQTNGVLSLKGSIGTKQQYLPQLMKGVGYETALIGKWHLKKEPGAFDYYEVLKLQGDYFDPTFRVRGDKPWPQNTRQYKGHSSDVVTDLSIEWLKSRSKEKPFFLMHQFKAPHDMFKYAPRYSDYLENVMIPEPTDLYGYKESFGSPATRGLNDSLIREIGTSISKRNPRRNMGKDLYQGSDGVGIDPSLPDREYTHQAYQKFLKAYLRCVKGVDDNIARLIQTLKEMGEYDNTIIIYTSDQGMMLGEHDMQDKRWIWDESIRMPFVVKHPQQAMPGRVSDLIINNTDFAPFILDLVGVETPQYMQGHSFAGELFGDTPEQWRSATYYRYWTHRMYHDVPAHVGLRTKDYKLVFYYGDNYRLEKNYTYYDRKWTAQTGKQPNKQPTPAGWELYDLSKDPAEQNNVYLDPAYKAVIKELKAELIRQRELYNETDEKYPDMKAIFDKNFTS